MVVAALVIVEQAWKIACNKLARTVWSLKVVHHAGIISVRKSTQGNSVIVIAHPSWLVRNISSHFLGIMSAQVVG